VWASRLLLAGGAVAAIGLIIVVWAMVWQDPGLATELADDAVHLAPVQVQPGAVRLETLARREPAPVWKHFAVVSDALPGQPMIAVVIDDMGIDAKRSREVIDLPAPLTTSFLPYGGHSAELAPLAHAGGHEILVHLPMQPLSDSVNPGPHALKVAMSTAEIDRQLDWNLGRFGGYVGVNNHMGSAFTEDAAGMREVLSQLNRRGLLFLDSRTIGGTVTDTASQGLDLPILQRDVFLDNVQEERAIWLQLKELERVARRQGYAIAIGHPHDATIRALKAWLPRARQEGFALVPLSAIVDAPQKTQLARR
jgi:polysaccharide deacetylase 2 family uncharacterized protein YibQ